MMPTNNWTSQIPYSLPGKVLHDSGLTWLAQIPAHWKLIKLKHVAVIDSGEMPPEDKSKSDGDYPVYGANGVIGYCGSFNLERDAIIIGRVGTSGAVNRATGRGWVSDNALIVYLEQKKADLRFVGYVLTMLDLGATASKSAQPLITSTFVKNIQILLPPLPTQRAIAHYLDRETARIDALVAAKERLLELLAEKRRGLITRAIKCGLNLNVPFRDSGISWLGQIPAHWETERAKWLFRERDERSKTGEEELLTVSHLTGVTPRSEKDVNMFEAETTEGYKLCYPGDLVVNTLWAWMGAMGVSPVHGIVSPAYNVYTPTERLDPAYVDALARIPVFAEEATRFSKGVWSSRLRLYPEGLFEIWMPVPPLKEQRTIVSYISTETAKLEALRKAAERTIELLKERRAALISDGVKGKIKSLS
jgi:type I restriction enzyme S subunit